MQRDSLVHVAATGGYGSVFEVDDKGICEVGLIDPCADDYSLRVPAHTLVEIEPVGRDQMDELLGALALFHLGVRCSGKPRRTARPHKGGDILPSKKKVRRFSNQHVCTNSH